MNSSSQTSRPSHTQDQFLTVLSREEAMARFTGALPGANLGDEPASLACALGRVLAHDVVAALDVPPFDRSLLDGFAVRAADTVRAGAGEPVLLVLNDEAIHCGTPPALTVAPGTATPIATGGPVPRGADAVVMIEHTDPHGPRHIALRRSASSGQGIGFAGSDMARGEVLLRRGAIIGSREIGMLAAVGLAAIAVRRRPRVAVISTGDELVQPGEPLRPAAIYDSNGPIVTAALAENGAEPRFFGAVGDDAANLARVLRDAHESCDMVILSGGTSKGAGDLTYRLVADLGEPGIVAHGVALKPGKPLCLAVADGKPVVVLPGFPTSAMFTFHDFVVPVIRKMAGLPARSESHVEATVPVRVASELGRTEFVMASLVTSDDGLVAHPVSKGSGSVTSFSQADGFFRIDALADTVPAGARVSLTLLDPAWRMPDLTVIGSHCLGLEAVIGALVDKGIRVRCIPVGSVGGLAALQRGECDLAPIHLLDPASLAYNLPFLGESLSLAPGWRRMQGVVFQPGDIRFEGREATEAALAAARDPTCMMVNRNQGSGTRILMDRLLAGARPDGYSNQPRSHNAVAAAVSQGRADWGLAVAPAAAAHGLGFLPLAQEHYDFAFADANRGKPAVSAFLTALRQPGVRKAIEALGFTPSPEAE
jgi:molybdenum cofactor synthesis domain-containing protein